VVRALETVTDEDGDTHPGDGWTRLVVTPDRPLRSVSALITGLHEPRATHLAMLESVSNRGHLERAYAEARRSGYLWHEFGDSHLSLGASRGRSHNEYERPRRPPRRARRPETLVAGNMALADESETFTRRGTLREGIERFRIAGAGATPGVELEGRVRGQLLVTFE
jgi:hypothetical protein